MKEFFMKKETKKINIVQDGLQERLSFLEKRLTQISEERKDIIFEIDQTKKFLGSCNQTKNLKTFKKFPLMDILLEAIKGGNRTYKQIEKHVTDVPGIVYTHRLPGHIRSILHRLKKMDQIHSPAHGVWEIKTNTETPKTTE